MATVFINNIDMHAASFKQSLWSVEVEICMCVGMCILYACISIFEAKYLEN